MTRSAAQAVCSTLIYSRYLVYYLSVFALQASGDLRRIYDDMSDRFLAQGLNLNFIDSVR